MQVNPPFDGSAPCPVCSDAIRGASAYVHNFLVRWPENKAFVKLNDLRNFVKPDDFPQIDHPDVVEFVSVVRDLIAACHDMVDDGRLRITWTPETRERIAALIPRAEAAEAKLSALSDAHFDDYRHSHGDENLLVESRGMTGIRFLPKREWHYTVECCEVAEGDMIHRACGQGIKLHEHFKERLRRDPKFYGKARCPRCRTLAPIAQFDINLSRVLGPGRLVPPHGSGPDNI